MSTLIRFLSCESGVAVVEYALIAGRGWAATLIEELSATKTGIELPKVRKPQWLKPDLRVRVPYLAGGDTLRHASVKSIASKYESE
jgi:Flp pilus assembly pilin Flp